MPGVTKKQAEPILARPIPVRTSMVVTNLSPVETLMAAEKKTLEEMEWATNDGIISPDVAPGDIVLIDWDDASNIIPWMARIATEGVGVLPEN